MKSDEIKQKITELLQTRIETPPTASEIAEALELRGAARKHLQKWLMQLVVDGEIVCIRKNRYALGQEADLLTGDLVIARTGAGFVSGKGYPDGVMIRTEDLSTALPGDRVIVRLHRDAPAAEAERPRRGRRGRHGAEKAERPRPAGREDRRMTGKVIRILERRRRDIVGTVRAVGNFTSIVPIDPAYRQDVYVADRKDANEGDRVVVRITDWPNKHVSPEGEILEVLGPEENPSVDTLSIIRHYGLNTDFPMPVLREAEEVSALVESPGAREDIRDKLILTIDPERARDFDDALSLERDADGNRVLGVHIADVSHFVREGSALDIEARERGNSVYLPDRVIPMLPEQLSNGICSLQPDVNRLAFSAFITYDRNGVPVARRFARTIIRSSKRFTYEEAMAAIDGADGELPRPLRELLTGLHRLAQQLRKRRFGNHALDLDIPEVEIVTDRKGSMTGIRLVPYDPSHQLVEECMVAANEAVATELSARGMTFISRLHEPPTESKIEALTAELQGMGHSPGDLRKPRNLAAFLRSIKDDPLGHHARIAVLKSMRRALYSADAEGHFGLAKAHYAHFTSPIRRYPDLVVHRILAARLAGAAPRSKREPSSLADTALHCSITEQKAEEAERALKEIMKLRYFERELANHSPHTYDALVVSVMNFGLFVELRDFQVQGLVHVSTLSDRFVRYDRNAQALRAGKQSFAMGDTIPVRLSAVDFEKRRLDFVPA